MSRLSDETLLDLVQRQTLAYFWDFGHPASGMARERSNPVASYDSRDTVCSGGTGFGIMAMLAGAARGFLPRAEVLDRISQIVAFLRRAETHHGVFPHFLHGATGATIPFSGKDDGGDLVETSYLMTGLLCARQYFAGDAQTEAGLRDAIDRLWHAVEWDWHTRGGRDALYWHWSPRHGWATDHAITGWNECLITYVLAAASPGHSVAPAAYHRGWADSPVFRNGKTYHGIELPLGPPYGGPLFFSHFSFLGLDPRGLCDRYADYWTQNRAHTLINRAHCIANPRGFAGYGPHCWGLTACDGDAGYRAFNPENDRGVIAPTAALSAMPYTPRESMDALRHFYEDLGGEIWGEHGFVDAFNRSRQWIADSNLAIDQGPIVVMIENYRSGLLWNLFMSCREVRSGLRRLGFDSPRLTTSDA
ncbi:MAG: glucoamylase family protein [Kiloniellales bacterium]